MTELKEAAGLYQDQMFTLTVPLISQDSKEPIHKVWRRRKFFIKYKEKRTKIHQQLLTPRCIKQLSHCAHRLSLCAHRLSLCHIVKLKQHRFFPLGLSLLQLLLLCSSGMLWPEQLMRLLSCKSRTTSLPHPNQMSGFLKCKGCKVRTNLNTAYLLCFILRKQSQSVSVEMSFADCMYQDTE